MKRGEEVPRETWHTKKILAVQFWKRLSGICCLSETGWERSCQSLVGLQSSILTCFQFLVGFLYRTMNTSHTGQQLVLKHHSRKRPIFKARPRRVVAQSRHLSVWLGLESIKNTQSFQNVNKGVCKPGRGIRTVLHI